MNKSVTINGIHMQKDLGAILSRTDCVQPPETETYFIMVPGRDGSLDMTEGISNRITYKNRTILMVFGCMEEKSRWPWFYSNMQNQFHGKKVKIMFDDDPGYYYQGRAQMTSYERFQTLGMFTLEISAEPYKYEMESSMDDWLWDPFSFQYGIIRGYKDIKISGMRNFNVIGSRMFVIPVFICSVELTVTYLGISYNLHPGKNKIYDICIAEGDNLLVFSGNGTVSIDFRGGTL